MHRPFKKNQLFSSPKSVPFGLSSHTRSLALVYVFLLNADRVYFSCRSEVLTQLMEP
jgi:hypothetical protein